MQKGEAVNTLGKRDKSYKVPIVSLENGLEIPMKLLIGQTMERPFVSLQGQQSEIPVITLSKV